MPARPGTNARLFWSKVDLTPITLDDKCWPWTGLLNEHGYGRYNGTYAHRVAWTLTQGDPGHLRVLHRCDNPICVRPDHLFLGTQADNMADMRSKGRQNDITRVRGEAHPKAKLTLTQVREIRARRASGETQASVARSYGVTPFTIRKIVQGTYWRDPT